MKNVITQFLQHADKQLEIMLFAGINENYELISNEAHALKGGTSNLQAINLSKLSEALEEFCEKGDNKRVLTNVLGLARALGQLDEYTRLQLFTSGNSSGAI